MSRPGYGLLLLGVAVVAGVVVLLLGIRADVVVVVVGLALYPAAFAAGRGAALGALSAALLVVPVAALLAPHPVATVLYGAAILVGAWSVARALRARRDGAAELVASRAAQAAAEERLRIAREVHDVVGHSLSLIAVRASVATHLADSHPEEGRAALIGIESISRAALVEVRAVLGAMRSPDDIDQLVAGAREAGVPVELSCADLADVPVVVRAAALRIVQEALTNVVRHTEGPAPCRVEVTVDGDALRIAVVDDGPARPITGPAGHGLEGVRERVAEHGGTLEAGPRPAGGFAVRARLPLRPGMTGG